MSASTDSATDNSRSARTYRWECDELLRGEASKKYGLIIVNQPIRRDLLDRAWKAAEVRLCADGGANRLYKVDEQQAYLPDMIKGDLDSIRDDVRTHYSSKGVPVVEDKDEYSTDLMKCIAEVPQDHALVLLGGLSGRVDQSVHTMAMLHKIDREIYVLDGESFAWLLRPGRHEIRIDHHTMGQTCGILPVGVDSARVKTQGLKWDTDWETSLNGNLSTSNHLLPENPEVVIETDRPILWTVEIRPLD
ncbi:thiamine pyrophosphokinase [Kwoniella heveanensis BCC8398]|uniref:Thiamine pyrophosphokinase n=1 Tax=Kwoniella heveanensis BCC8398 TaxID=1296120 RepID=A0A1B9GKQ8_9TREE|nr:thiamine pyrophosphokinase [Kwoniella heveanensis BCC8398]